MFWLPLVTCGVNPPWRDAFATIVTDLHSSGHFPTTFKTIISAATNVMFAFFYVRNFATVIAIDDAVGMVKVDTARCHAEGYTASSTFYKCFFCVFHSPLTIRLASLTAVKSSY